MSYIKQYRKKPVVIDAAELTRDNWPKVAAWCAGQAYSLPNIGMQGITINTLEGNMLANFGDYIIKGVRGEFYPCKSDIFKATYDEEQA